MFQREAGRRFVVWGLPILLASSAGVGCGGDDATDATQGPSGASSGRPSAVVEVTAVDYAFEGLPDSMDPGTELAVKNASAGEVHEIVALHLPEDEARGAEELLALPQAEIQTAGSFVGVTVAMPGEGGFAPAGPLVLRESGRYLLFCAIPTGADPSEYQRAIQEATDGPPEVDGGPPHYGAGMFAAATVA